MLTSHLATELSSFGLLDYRDRRHGKLHSPRTARMTEKSPDTPIAIGVHTKKEVSTGIAEAAGDADTFPPMWTYGTNNDKSDPSSIMMYADRRPPSTSAPYSQTKEISAVTTRFESPPGSKPCTMSSAR